MLEAIVVVLSLHSEILSVGHFEPKKEFASKQQCLDWLNSDEGDKAWRQLGSGYRAVFPGGVRVRPACFEPGAEV